METRKRVWIAVLCLLSAAALTISLRHHVTRVQAATLPPHATSISPTTPATPMANASLRAAAVRNAILLDDADATRVTGTKQPGRIVFPPVEQFTLTPPNPAQGVDKTTIAVRFGTGAEKLPAQFPMLLGTQRVTVQRSGEAPDIYLTAVNFDWQTFAKEQAQRKEAAVHGKMVPIFHGRKFIRTEPMQFMDPAQIEGALQSHQPLQLSPGMLTGGPSNVVPDHELMITAIPVVEDQQRTFDQCLPAGQQGNSSGAWTFNTLMQAIACSTGSNNCTQQAAENMLLSMLSSWQSDKTVNTFPVMHRNIGVLGQSGLLGNWPTDTLTCNSPSGPVACPSLPNAPVHLLAIVNRIDLGQNFPPFNSPFPPGGELRFVFNVTANTSFNGTPAPCSAQGTQNAGNNPFTIILEFSVPQSFTALEWADQWNMLQDPTDNFGTTYRNDLQNDITNLVVMAGACSQNGAPVSCLAQIRTNEIEISNNGLWEQRQFQLPTATLSTQPILNLVTVSMTPDSSFNTDGQPPCPINGDPCNNSGDMGTWINNNESEIIQTGGTLPLVPAVLPNGDHFLGGSVFNNALAFWVDGVPLLSEEARIDFSVNTCNGCHGGETHTPFLQVNPRSAGTPNGDQPSVLSNFLLGCAPTTGAGSCGTGAGPDTCMPGQPNQCALNMPGQEAVPDPNPPHSVVTAFGDILRRQIYMSGVLSGGPGSGGMLLPFLAQPVGVH